MVVAVRMVARFVRMVVGRRGGANLLLETRQRDAVDTHVAIHADVPRHGLVITLDHKVSDALVRSEVSGVADLDVGVCGGELFTLVADAFFENAGEEEVGEDYDALRAKLATALQPPAATLGGVMLT